MTSSESVSSQMQTEISLNRQLLTLTLWLASSMRSRLNEGVIMADRRPLAWAPIRLSTEHVKFDTSSLETDVQVHGPFKIISKDGLTRSKK